MPRVRFEPSGRTAEASPGETILDLAGHLSIPIESVCGGRGKCGRCRVIVRASSLPISPEDAKFLSEEELDQGVRLACRFKIVEDTEVETLGGFSTGEQIILQESSSHAIIDPLVRAIDITLRPPTLLNPLSDHERLETALLSELEGKRLHIPHSLLAKLPSLLKGESFTLVLRHNELLDIFPRGSKRPLGVAIDVGTTTVVAYLIDLQTGAVLAVNSAMNPQIRHGDDVISRITYTMEKKEGVRTLQHLIAGCISDLVAKDAAAIGVPLEDIYEIMAVGNTAMHHMMFGLESRGLTLCPYVPVISAGLDVKAPDLGIRINQEGYLASLPNVAGFVGADHVAVLLAAQLESSDKVRMAIDIGTNGEITVGSSQGMASTSCAAGPAFEGANLKFGMRGATGAVDHVSISPDFQVSYTTIGNAPARGICGSGVVDVVAEMVRRGIIDRTGRIVEELEIPQIRVEKGQSQFIIVPAKESALKKNITIVQDDIIQIQFAKAAMYAGATILMNRVGVESKDLDAVLLAGAFGNYVNADSARTIGLFPEVPLDRIIGIGNAAGSGAKIALIDKKARAHAQELARRTQYVELAAQPEFEEVFYDALYFPHSNPALFPEVTKTISAV